MKRSTKVFTLNKFMQLIFVMKREIICKKSLCIQIQSFNRPLHHSLYRPSCKNASFYCICNLRYRKVNWIGALLMFFRCLKIWHAYWVEYSCRMDGNAPYGCNKSSFSVFIMVLLKSQAKCVSHQQYNNRLTLKNHYLCVWKALMKIMI